MSDAGTPHPLRELAAQVQWPDQAAGDALRRRAQPGWGRLADHGEWLAAAQGMDPPTVPRRIRLIRVADAGSLPEPLPGDAIAGVLDVPLDAPAGHGSTTDVAAHVDAGAALADAEVDSGTDLVVITWADDGAVPMAVIAALTNTEPVKTLPRGVVLAPDEWIRRAAAVRDLRRVAVAARDEPDELVAAIAAIAAAEPASAPARLAGVTGVLLRCAARRTPVLLDGLGALAAATLGHHAQAAAGAWWRAADTCAHPAHELALSRLGHRPVLDLGSAGEDGSAGVVAVAALRWAVHVARGDAAG